MPATFAKPPNAVGLGLDGANVVLTTLRDTARLTGVPYLRDAAGLAVGILEIIQVRELLLIAFRFAGVAELMFPSPLQNMRDNKDAYRRLAEAACGLVYAIIKHTNKEKNTSAISTELHKNLRELKGCVLGFGSPVSRKLI